MSIGPQAPHHEKATRQSLPHPSPTRSPALPPTEPPGPGSSVCAEHLAVCRPLLTPPLSVWWAEQTVPPEPTHGNPPPPGCFNLPGAVASADGLELSGVAWEQVKF